MASVRKNTVSFMVRQESATDRLIQQEKTRQQQKIAPVGARVQPISPSNIKSSTDRPNSDQRRCQESRIITRNTILGVVLVSRQLLRTHPHNGRAIC